MNLSAFTHALLLRAGSSGGPRFDGGCWTCTQSSRGSSCSDAAAHPAPCPPRTLHLQVIQLMRCARGEPGTPPPPPPPQKKRLSQRPALWDLIRDLSQPPLRVPLSLLGQARGGRPASCPIQAPSLVAAVGGVRLSAAHSRLREHPARLPTPAGSPLPTAAGGRRSSGGRRGGAGCDQPP